MMGHGSDCAARWAKKSRYVQSYVGQVGASGGLATPRLDSDDIPSRKALGLSHRSLAPPKFPGYTRRCRRYQPVFQ
jgi:hypothetical protein